MLYNKIEPQWTQRYRPQRLEDVVIPEAIKNRLIKLRDNNESINLLLHGPYGTGKTTISLLINTESTLTIQCGTEEGKKQINDIVSICSSATLYSESRVVVFDEAEYISKKGLAILRTGLERLSKSNMFVFTTNNIDKIDPGIRSRLTEYDFGNFDGDIELREQFVQRGIAIVENEGVSNYKIDTIRSIAKSSLPDARKFVSELQRNYG